MLRRPSALVDTVIVQSYTVLTLIIDTSTFIISIVSTVVLNFACQTYTLVIQTQ
jgi:hypothetical protein